MSVESWWAAEWAHHDMYHWVGIPPHYPEQGDERIEWYKSSRATCMNERMVNKREISEKDRERDGGGKVRVRGWRDERQYECIWKKRERLTDRQSQWQRGGRERERERERKEDRKRERERKIERERERKIERERKRKIERGGKEEREKGRESER